MTVSKTLSTSKLALSIKCPLCKSKPNDPCTYVDDKWEWWWFDDPDRGYVAVTRHLKGEPFQSKNVHMERFERYKYNKYRERTKAYYAQLKAQDNERTAMRTAYYQYAQQEHEELQEWLRQYGAVLIFKDKQ